MLSAGQDLACPRCSARFFWPVCSLYRSVHACCCYAHKASFFFSQCLCVMWSVTQLCPTLCDPMDYSLPGSSVHGIFQARILECIAISYSRESSWPRNLTCISYISSAGRQILYRSATMKLRKLQGSSNNTCFSSSSSYFFFSASECSLTWISKNKHPY